MKRYSPRVDVGLFWEAGVPPEALTEVHKGIEVVGRHLGEISIAASREVVLDTPVVGILDVDEIEWLVPFEGDQITVVATTRRIFSTSHPPQLDVVNQGYALFASKIAIVRAGIDSGISVRNLTIHELAHLAGLKDKRKRKHDVDHPHHCADPSCLMYFRVPCSYEELETRGLKQFEEIDFCKDCKADLNQVRLRLARAQMDA